VLAAMENPHVDCIGHPTSRRIGVRSPSGIEIEKVVEAALATGTFLEINSQPDRLDLRDAHARLAGEAGLRLVISSDGHSTNALRYVDLGVAQARRAWLTKDQIRTRARGRRSRSCARAPDVMRPRRQGALRGGRRGRRERPYS
jgi:DNA polymerase (family 10)